MNYLKTFKSSITRIYHPNGAVVGAGFLVSQQYVLTCAHVVAAALGISEETLEAPNQSIDLDFPLITPGQKLQAKVELWQPVQAVSSTATAIAEDIAVLKLETLANASQPVRLVTAEDLWEHPIRVFGFPQGHDSGVWASGVLRGEVSNGWVQMEDVKVAGYEVEPGFSGAPVWDEKLEGVVGMAVAAERQRQGVKAAFLISTRVLSQTWAELNQFLQLTTTPKTTISKVQQVRMKVLQGRLDSLIADYEAAYNQLDYTLSEVDRNRIKRQVVALEQEMNSVESELTAILD